MQEVKRKKGETFESFMRRFKKRLIQSGVLLSARANRYQEKDLSRNLQKKKALERKVYKEKLQFLKKIGKLPEDQNNKKRY